LTTPTSKRHWYHLTPARFFIGLLAVQVFLLLSEQFQWFPFNEKKGWTVLIAVGVVGVALLVMLVWGLVYLLLRRRFQFSFRSLLVFLVAVSVPLGWLTWETEKARRQREAVEGMLRFGASVCYDYQFDENGDWIGGEKPTRPLSLRALAGDDFFCEVVRVSCWNSEFGDNDARNLNGMTTLKELWLNDAIVTDSGLEFLHEMKRLEELSLAGTLITDSGLKHINGLTNLRVLSLNRTRVTDEGAEKLQPALPDCQIAY
jgi:hypothetical protein